MLAAAAGVGGESRKALGAKPTKLSIDKEENGTTIDAVRSALQLHIDHGFSRLYKIPTKKLKDERERGQKRLSRDYLDGEFTREFFGQKGGHILNKKEGLRCL